MGNCNGQNMDLGHVIRLRAAHVKAASADEVALTIAHELAHTEQKADGI
jgi:hypothetical protein